MVAGPARRGAAGRGHLRASDADRERVIGTLKAAFVQGRVTMDELSVRAGQALAARTYAELAVIIADIPAWVSKAQPPPEPARARRTVSRRTAAWAACVIISAALWAIFATYYGGFIVLLLFAFAGLTLTAAPVRPDTRRQAVDARR